MNKTNVGGLPHGSYIVTDNSAVIAALQERIAELEKKQEFVPLDASWVYVKEEDVNLMVNRIAELEKENQTIVEQHDMWKNQWHELNYSLLSRDLEQQLKILKEYANTCGILRQEPSTRSLHELIMDLEAKALKEQSE